MEVNLPVSFLGSGAGVGFFSGVLGRLLFPEGSVELDDVLILFLSGDAATRRVEGVGPLCSFCLFSGIGVMLSTPGCFRRRDP